MFSPQAEPPLARAHWTLWMEDRFDTECPRQVEQEGTGLYDGLKALWMTHMREGVSPNGQATFYKFNLWCTALEKSIDISGTTSAMMKIHQWLFWDQLNLPI